MEKQPRSPSPRFWDKFKPVFEKVKTETLVYRLVLNDPGTPFLAKFLLFSALLYLAMPFDLIPDFIPILGQLDDLIIVGGLVYLALKFIPREVLENCRQTAEQKKPDAHKDAKNAKKSL